MGYLFGTKVMRNAVVAVQAKYRHHVSKKKNLITLATSGFNFFFFNYTVYQSNKENNELCLSFLKRHSLLGRRDHSN